LQVALLQAARRVRWLLVPAWGWFWLLLSAVGLANFGMACLGLFPTGDTDQEVIVAKAGHVAAAFGLVALVLLLAAVLVGSGQWFRLGRRLGRRLERGNPAHVQGVVGLIVFATTAFVPLAVLGGEAPLPRIIEHNASMFGPEQSAAGLYVTLVATLAWLALLALVGAGVPAQRGLRAGLAHLSILPLRRRDLPAVCGAVVGLLAVVTALGAALEAVRYLAGMPGADAFPLEALIGSTVSPLDALALSLTAGVGEGLLFRGLLQPRFGWFLPNLAFVAAHGWQYGPDGLLLVSVLGAGLALVRARLNTAAAVLTHGLYDLVLLLTLALGPSGA
jgi:hypothetical protein